MPKGGILEAFWRKEFKTKTQQTHHVVSAWKRNDFNSNKLISPSCFSEVCNGHAKEERQKQKQKQKQRRERKKESALEDMKLREYDKWKNIDSDDEDRVGSLQQRGAANEDQVMRQLLELQKEDPGKLKELDAQLEAAKKAAKSLKEGQRSTNDVASDVNRAVNMKKKEMEKTLRQLEEEHNKIFAQQERLEQLMGAGDAASVFKFFEQQGMSREQIQRIIGGSTEDSKDVMAAQIEHQTKATNSGAVEDNLLFTEQLHNAICGNDEVKDEFSEMAHAQEVKSPSQINGDDTDSDKVSEKSKPTILLPSYSQRVSKKGSIVVKVSLPN